MGIKIITDSACDLPIEYIRENNIDVVSLTVNINGEFIPDDLGQTLKYDEFYKMIREGGMPSTAQVNVGTFEEVFKKYIEKGDSIIYIGLSSSLSGTFNSSNIAMQGLLEEYPNADISIIDSLSVSLGEGAIVYYICEMIKNGSTKEEVIRWAEENKRKIIHAITVDDLNHLKRGGRISGATAAVGSLLGIKPTLILDNEGKVVPGAKIKGRKKAMRYLVQEIRDKAVNIEEQVLFICHADCIKDAEELKEMVLAEFKVKDVILNSIGAVVGTHGGPGTLATIFIGTSR
ncbi:DegV family protein [Clostridium chauvoei]|uniref:DegV family protein n=2 Tax=Clostridium chauvoei TaxID=46867 RepID=A0ABD4RFV3_9CLOT|nr:DegV family protein [Clostridium chauvoei]ATD55793.1 fatty acid-binding protein DegV [Clostridium chauvoei]ATD56533.1 fatty acid-binding protein DegV [Clostridium chauvoei]MBX7280339.1 DegV family protein [Clostridium chauvoei]MBX7282824.1 DegV family protein [Clostridium chauvoei]MBX7285230.1 DegV family protein [Clostridium chauvoei]